MPRNEFQVVQYTYNGLFVGVIAGLGRNKGTWDSTHSEETARMYARQLGDANHAFVYKVEPL